MRSELMAKMKAYLNENGSVRSEILDRNGRTFFWQQMFTQLIIFV